MGFADKILCALERFKKTEQWLKDGGRFIPYPAAWHNSERWKDDFANVSRTGPIIQKARLRWTR